MSAPRSASIASVLLESAAAVKTPVCIAGRVPEEELRGHQSLSIVRGAKVDRILNMEEL